ncbi:MAG: tRNA lysidine(34) synthetase TilS [Crocinitomicaceae bacterium]|nr:tRNA lysidine(34) synthetase TilS [Crocinitomicaceae bacterium]
MANNRDGLVQHLRHWLARQSIESNATLIVGVSGGLDSMVLAETLHRTGIDFHVAHVNYHLRGEASDADQALVEAWCAARDAPCAVLHANVDSTDHGVQAEARKIRYSYFERMRTEAQQSNGCPAYIVTAHHGDDQAETVLLHLIRSADPLALSAMPDLDAKRGLLRPFLNLSRANLAEACDAWSVAYHEDASNAKPDYLRNRIRHEVLPLLESLRPGTANHVAHWASRFQSLRSFFDMERNEATARCWTASYGKGELALSAWLAEPLRLEILHRLAHEHGIAARAVPELLHLTEAHVESGAHFVCATARVERRGKALYWISLI